ncbi:MAG: hypothetical protein ACRDQD_21860, partial [Nocardioidaceae bacterium]
HHRSVAGHRPGHHPGSSLPSSMWVLQLQENGHGTHLDVAVSGRVNVHLAFREPYPVRTRKGEMVVTGVSLWVDQPREVVVRIREKAASQARRQ